MASAERNNEITKKTVLVNRIDEKFIHQFNVIVLSFLFSGFKFIVGATQLLYASKLKNLKVPPR